MENISYIGLSHQMALTSRMNVTANNIANMSTPGYKGQRAMFVDYLNKAKDGGPKDAIHQVQDYATYRNVEQGSLQMTSNPLDIALEGKGYFAVTTPTGTAYTRNGSFSLNADGQLVTKQGYLVQSDGGAELTIPEGAKHIGVTPDGMLTTEQGDVGMIKMVDFADQQRMEEMGDGLYTVGGAAEIPVEPTTRMVQSAVESSNVNPILEMNNMVEVLRAYQSTYRMLTNDHERIRGAIQKLTRV